MPHIVAAVGCHVGMEMVMWVMWRESLGQSKSGSG